MRYILAAALVVFAGLASPGRAAPWCVSNQMIPPQCIYTDVNLCAQEARKQNGQCQPNPRERKLSAVNGQYCVVSPSGAPVCAYWDYATCSAAAGQNNGTCVQADPRQAPLQPNPYSAVNGQ
jgi:hypothetical protein